MCTLPYIWSVRGIGSSRPLTYYCLNLDFLVNPKQLLFALVVLLKEGMNFFRTLLFQLLDPLTTLLAFFA